MNEQIRQGILDYKKPFCITNLYIYFERLGITDKNSILNVLDEMFDEGIIIYDEIPEEYTIANGPKYAFMVK